ncbi:MAG: hypothetical protein CBD72_05495 [Flavobacteriaceae bacterium TMED212]|mgnify:CR=1 FL=1|nr:MAG: hypothetical protein CBD72_05495 [Flavobacteriaceae bacterium TMED212]
MKNKSKINFYNFLFFFALYVSLIVGFLFGENLNYGAKPDWLYTDISPIKDFANSFKETFLNYDKYNHRHSPVYIMFLSYLFKTGLSFEWIRFIHLNLSLLLLVVFYRCLLLKFQNIDRNILLLLSLSIFLSPTFRSLAIWPDTRIIGLIFFTLSIYEFLKYCEDKKKINYYKNILYLIISSYISPNFSVFIIFFFYTYIKELNLGDILKGFLISLLLGFPALYYLFILDVNFLLALTPGDTQNQSLSLSYNFSNKILIISTIILFHLIPMVLNKKFFTDLRKSIIKNFLFIIFFLILNILFFDYVLRYTGGGVFFQFSNLIFGNNILFFIISFFSLSVLGYFSKENIKNSLVFILLIISNVQNTIYHKYYDPLILILFFTLINNFLPNEFLKKKFNVIFIYIFYFGYIILRVVKNKYFAY